MPTWKSREPVRPASLFRIASVSKPFTATAVLHLVEQGRLKLDERVLPLLKLEPHLERGARLDPRWHEIRVHHCLQHTAGWDRDKSFDPMSAATAEQVAKALKIPLPDPSQGHHPLHDGQAAGFRPRHGLCLFQFRLLRAGPGDRGRCEKALPRVRVGADSRPAGHPRHAAGEEPPQGSRPRRGDVLRQPPSHRPRHLRPQRSASRCRCPTASSASRRWTPTAAGSPRPWT